MSLGEAVLVGLAAWRIACLLVFEDGPWDLLQRLRDLAGVDRPGPVGPLAKLFSCVWCMSFWTSLIMAAIFEYVWSPPVTFLAAAGLSLLLERSVSAEKG